MSDSTPRVAPWEDVVLRGIAIYKVLKAFLALALAVTFIKLVHHDVTQFLQDFVLGPLHFDPDDESESRFVNWLLRHAEDLTPHTIRLLAYASFFYAAVFAVEGVGLYLKKHWAEYMVLLVTGSFLPFEVYTFFHHQAWWKAGLIVGNILIIGYLAHRIRLDARLAAQRKMETEPLPPTAPVPSAASSKRVVSEVP